MYKVLLSAGRPDALSELAAGLEKDGRARLHWARGDQETLVLTKELAPHLVLIDGQGREKEALALVSELLMVNAMVNTAVVSAMDEEEFHETSEGLGILASLPPSPGAGLAEGLLDKLASVAGPPPA
ncbi:MAG: response regulator [Proteobacteria bacterium]|nr:response regulator [Pseudomonadota bacterium]MBU1451238.1 response regulator [Pseudomonadota bacterium]MBU2468119.1 response regulator [Pseudomonadota bacterium]MBU2516363.1 response regulator [Pseudomonadota bacterium]